MVPFLCNLLMLAMVATHLQVSESLTSREVSEAENKKLPMQSLGRPYWSRKDVLI